MPEKPEAYNKRVSEMTSRCGADVEEAFQKGLIGPRQYREFLQRCSGCEDPEACENLLETKRVLAAAPDYCENKDEIAELKQKLENVRRERPSDR